MGALKYEDHMRAWSLMDLMLREDRERWLQVLAQLRRRRRRRAPRSRTVSGITPDEFNERWVDRLTGKRPTMGEIRADATEGEEEPGARERGASARRRTRTCWPA